MDVKSYHRCRKWSTITGCYLLASTTGFMWYWGNMSIYVVSLILSHEARTRYILAPWTVSIYLISLSVGFMACGTILKLTSIRFVIFIGAVIGTLGKILSYFTVLYSMPFFDVTMGFFVGLGNGLLNGATLQCVAVWADNDVAFVIGLVQSSLNVGGIVTNQFVTLYVNPHEETPDRTVEGLLFFSQQNVIGNVSSMILVLGFIYLVLKIIGFAMLRNRSPNTKCTPALELNESSTILENGNRQINNESTLSQPRNEMTSMQMVRTKEFYLLLFGFLSVETAFVLIMNYYKVFGQLYIKDDHFLTNTATYMNISGLLAKLFLGYVTDKLGVKRTLVVVLAILVTFGSFYLFTVLIDIWLYTAFTILLSSSTATQALFSGFIGKQFGKENVSSNFGVLSICQMALMLALPVIIENYVTQFGWFALTFIATIPAMVALIFVAVFMPNDK